MEARGDDFYIEKIFFLKFYFWYSSFPPLFCLQNSHYDIAFG
jgi:hypothetical protein